MNSCELVTLISALACSISSCFPPEETAVIAAAFTQLGDSLATILAHSELCEKKEEIQN